ncbi:MAG: hypothetical protein HUU36_11755, partial [Candidatus Omnitrophica bacterium]|nr:hypothetical protein [Candidatus Omnitrophota bacterium]
MKWLIALLLDSRPWREGNCRLKFLLSGVLLTVLAGCATPGLMKRWEREEQSPIESRHFVIFVDEGIDRAVGLEVLDALEFARERVGQACGYYCDDKIICNLGTGNGFSVRQIIAAAEEVTGRKAPVTFGPRRPGDA